MGVHVLCVCFLILLYTCIQIQTCKHLYPSLQRGVSLLVDDFAPVNAGSPGCLSSQLTYHVHFLTLS